MHFKGEFSKVGKRVLLVERAHLGGECTNAGCIPSKALLHHAKSYHQAITIAGHTPDSETYRTQAFSYVRSKINELLETETPETFIALGITVCSGEARLISPTCIQVCETRYSWDVCVIATGSQPRPLTVPGLNQSKILTNQNLFTLDQIPKQTLVIGGGPIGLEMGQALALLGSRVTIVTNDSIFARPIDPAIRPILENHFITLGVAIERGATLTRVESNSAWFERTTGSQTNEMFSVAFDAILIAIGRIPVFPCGLAAANIKYTTSGIEVDSQYRTSNPHVYAIGDVSQSLQFTHTADDAARQVVAHVVSRGIVRVQRTKAVPKVIYTLPELAQVGLSWEEAVGTYVADRLFRIEVPFSHNDRARTDNDTTGLLVVITTRVRGRILGAHIIGPTAGELINLFTLTIDKNISLWQLRRIIFAYPTYARTIKKAGDYFLTQQRQTLRSDLLYWVKHALPKISFLSLWLIALYLLYSYKYAFGLTTTELALKLFFIIENNSWTPLLYILAYTVSPLTFFPSTILTILSGVFFGFWGGVTYTIIGANLSASVAYCIGRYVGISTKLETSLIGSYIALLRSHPFETILTLRLIFIPFDAVNYGAGILRLPYLPFILATAVGTILGIATFVSLGSSVNLNTILQQGITASVIDGSFILLSVVIFIASLTIAQTLKRIKLKRKY